MVKYTKISELAVKKLGATAMKKVTKPTTHDVFDSIWFDYHYPEGLDRRGDTEKWIPSKDIQNKEFVAYMEAVEHFVDSVAKSAELPFVFDKNFIRTTINKPNNLGELFYKLLDDYNKNVLDKGRFKSCPEFLNTFRITDNRKPYKYEVSENMGILSDVASDLNLNRANFTRDPMSKMTDDGLLEGELINSFINYLGKATRRKSFKTKVEERKKESSQNFNKTKRYIERLHANHPDLDGVRMVICYQKQYADSIKLQESDDHLMAFLKALKTDSDSTLDSPVGWWWKREYMSELGYFYYLIVFFQTRRDETEIDDIYNRHWSSITKERGKYFVPDVPDRDYERCPIILLRRRYIHNPESFLSSIQRMLMRDIFLRLEGHQKLDYCGMGELPKLAENDI